jgi:hypothetical protein
MLAACRTQPWHRWRVSPYGKNSQIYGCFCFSESSSTMCPVIAGPPHSEIYQRNEPSRMSFRNYLESSRTLVWLVTSQGMTKIMTTESAMNHMKDQGKHVVGVCIASTEARGADTVYKRYACPAYTRVQINLSSLRGSRQESRGVRVTEISFAMGADSLRSHANAARQPRKKGGVARGREFGGSLTNNKRGSKICSGT